jgi:hypothetical protein
MMPTLPAEVLYDHIGFARGVIEYPLWGINKKYNKLWKNMLDEYYEDWPDIDYVGRSIFAIYVSIHIRGNERTQTYSTIHLDGIIDYDEHSKPMYAINYVNQYTIEFPSQKCIFIGPCDTDSYMVSSLDDHCKWLDRCPFQAFTAQHDKRKCGCRLNRFVIYNKLAFTDRWTAHSLCARDIHIPLKTYLKFIRYVYRSALYSGQNEFQEEFDYLNECA